MTQLVMTLALLYPSAPPTKPLAMILAVKGPVEVKPAKGKPRPARVQGLLYDGDQLTIPADGQATLVFLSDSHRERLKPKGQVTVGVTGCTPATAIEQRKEPGPEKKVLVPGLKEVLASSRAATSVVRSPAEEKKTAVTPITGTSLLTDRPAFAWPTDPKAKGYLVELYTSTGRLVWQAESTEARLTYPSDKKLLSPNRQYTWRVLSNYEDEHKQLAERKQIATGDFYFVTAQKAAELKALEPLAHSADLGEVQLAALAYEANKVYDAALRLYERMCQAAPLEPAFHAARAVLYEQAGRSEDAAKAWATAEKLGFVRPAKAATGP
jgi:hypothetical protein